MTLKTFSINFVMKCITFYYMNLYLYISHVELISLKTTRLTL